MKHTVRSGIEIQYSFFCDYLWYTQLGPLSLIWINLILAWISDYIHYEVWYEITYPFPNFPNRLSMGMDK